MCILTDKIFL